MTNVEKPARTALIVDDEPALLELLDTVLLDEGFVTTCFGLGRPALEALAKRPFDVLVLDVNLPDMNGMRIGEQARALYGDTVTILIITADARTERCITAFQLGADDFVGKPFDIDELLARIEVKLRRVTGAEV